MDQVTDKEVMVSRCTVQLTAQVTVLVTAQVTARAFSTGLGVITASTTTAGNTAAAVHGADLSVHGADLSVHGADLAVHWVDLSAL